MRTSRVFCIAAALSGIAATSASAAEYTFDPSFGNRIVLRNTDTDLLNSPDASLYLNDADNKGAGYAANVVTNGSAAFFFSSAIAAGRGNSAKSITQLDVNFTNVGGDGLKGISSTIFPATFGLYVAPFTPAANGCTGATLPTCPGVDAGLPNFLTLRDGRTAGDPFNTGQAGSSFLFEVLVDDKVQRSIGGAVVMQDANVFGNTQNPGLGLGEPVVIARSFIDDGHGNIVQGDINLLAGVLPGFKLLVEDDYSLIWGWDESPFTVAFKEDDFIIGEGTVTYRITTKAWGDSRRLLPGVEIDPIIEERSIVAFSCFADPVGRGSTRGAIIPLPVCDDFGGFGGEASRIYRLVGGSIDENGIFSLKSVIPEPDTWAMLIVGFGLIGLSMRRSKKAVPATAS